MAEEKKTAHVKALEPETLIISLIMSALSAVICIQILAKIGFSANTSIIGALLAMTLARVPLGSMKKFRSLDRQNLVQTMCSGAGFAASNCGITAVAILYILGEHQYAYYMVIGGALATIISIVMVYNVFDSALYPAAASWPPGIATAEALFAGDQGGRRAMRLFEGLVVGIVGSAIKIPAAWIGIPGTAAWGLPMAGMGIVFLANLWSMGALAVGLLIRGYAPVVLGIDLGKTYIPQGVMIGAGLASLVQVLIILYKSAKNKESEVTEDGKSYPVTVTPEGVKRAMIRSFIMYGAASLLLATLCGIATGIPAPKLVLWVAWCAISCLISPVLTGLCAMRSGWFPAFAITTIFLTFGMFMGFPPVALAVLTGFIACTGPCFADMGYDLKTGWILRGRGENLAYELDGRKQQLIAELIGCVLAYVIVALTMGMYFKLDLLPPVSRVFATTVQAVGNPAIITELAKWALLGAAIQFAFGSNKAMGILLATGLLIYSPLYGIGVLLTVIVRLIWGNEWMEIREAGLIAGDGIYGFCSAIWRVF